MTDRMLRPFRGIFVTGTDTDVGKTVASAWLMRALDADYWKPVQAGLNGETDTDTVKRLAGLPDERFHPSAYRLQAPLSPHEAARREGIAIDAARFELPDSSRPIVVEGAGGLMVPLNGDFLMIDLIARLKLPAVLVTRTVLGTINHTLLSLEAIRGRGLPLLGVVLNGAPDDANRHAIEIFGNVRVVGELPRMAAIDHAAIADVAERFPPRLPMGPRLIA